MGSQISHDNNDTNNKDDHKMIDPEERRIIDSISKINNKDCKTILIDGVNIMQRQNRAVIFCHSKRDMIGIYDGESELVFKPSEIENKTYGYGLVTLPNGNIVLFGGYDKYYGRCSLKCQLFDIKNNSSAETENMIEKRHNCAAILLRNGNILIVGGTDYYKSVDSCELYNPLSKKFSLMNAKMCIKKYRPVISLLPDGKVIILGGTSGNGALSSTEIYDPSIDVFTTGPDMIVPRFNHTATTLLNGNILICGGENRYMTSITTEIYDSKKGIFIKGPDMLRERAYHFATLLSDGKVLICDKQSYGNDISIEVYDPKTNSFSKAVDFPIDKRDAIIHNFVAF